MEDGAKFAPGTKAAHKELEDLGKAFGVPIEVGNQDVRFAPSDVESDKPLAKMEMPGRSHSAPSIVVKGDGLDRKYYITTRGGILTALGKPAGPFDNLKELSKHLHEARGEYINPEHLKLLIDHNAGPLAARSERGNDGKRLYVPNRYNVINGGMSTSDKLAEFMGYKKPEVDAEHAAAVDELMGYLDDGQKPMTSKDGSPEWEARRGESVRGYGGGYFIVTGDGYSARVYPALARGPDGAVLRDADGMPKFGELVSRIGLDTDPRNLSRAALENILDFVDKFGMPEKIDSPHERKTELNKQLGYLPTQTAVAKLRQYLTMAKINESRNPGDATISEADQPNMFKIKLPKSSSHVRDALINHMIDNHPDVADSVRLFTDGTDNPKKALKMVDKFLAGDEVKKLMKLEAEFEAEDLAVRMSRWAKQAIENSELSREEAVSSMAEVFSNPKQGVISRAVELIVSPKLFERHDKILKQINDIVEGRHR